MVFNILKTELKLFLRDKVALLLLVTLPFLFIWFFTVVLGPYLNANRYSEPFQIAVVDEDDNPASRMIIQQFETADHMKGYVKVLHTGRSEAIKRLKANEIAGIVIIPNGLMRSIYNGQNMPFIFIGNSTRKTASEIIKNELASAADFISAGQSAINTVWTYTDWGGADYSVLEDQFNEASYKFTMDSLGRSKYFKEETIAAVPNVTIPEYFTAALLVVFVTFLGVRGTKCMLEERKPGLSLRFKASPLKLWQFVLGKFLATFILLFGQLSLLLLASGLLFKNYLGGPLGSTALLITSVAFAVAAWVIFIGSAAPTARVADLLGYVGTPLLAIIGGNIYPLTSLPETVRELSRFTFNRWAMEGFLKIFAGSLSVMGDAAILLGMGALLLVASSTALSLAWRKNV